MGEVKVKLVPKEGGEGKTRIEAVATEKSKNPAKKTQMQTDNLTVDGEERKVHVVAMSSRATNRSWD